ncbi:MAG: HEAT repeat domain-containing protein [Calditrichae bacterium]|nr:HEAT repeat domain-containing protein [Calditrichia bacterium]
MKTLFQKLFDIRDGELKRALLMFAYVFLIISSLLMLKPVRNSLFLDRFNASQLPYVFILVAIAAAVVSTYYTRFSNQLRLNKLIRGTLVIVLVCLLAFWALLKFDVQQSWFVYVFYVWVAIFGAITTSQFWVMANYVFNAREARRLFSFIGAGAISGGIFGGYLTNLALVIGTENLLLICFGFVSICLFILRIVWRERPTDQRVEKNYQQRQFQQKSAGNPLTIFKNSNHLTVLASIVGVSVIVANLVDYQFNAVVEASIGSKDGRTAFFGVWLSNLSIVSLGIQLFLTRRMLSKLGVVASLLLLPLGIFVGAVSILIFPELWAAVLIKVADGSFKQSINKASFELLYLPVPSSVKTQAKSFIDVFVDSLATGVGGVMLIIFNVWLGFSTGQVSLLIIGLIVIWGALIWQVRREYINAFRLAIEKRTIDLEDFSVNPEEAALFDSLLKILEGDNSRQILYALKLLENVKNQQFVEHLKRLLDHHSAEIREQALRLLSKYETVDISEAANQLLSDESQSVRLEAVGYLVQKAVGKQKVAVLQNFLQSDEYRVNAAALMFAAREYGENPDIREAFDLPKLIEKMLSGTETLADPEAKSYIRVSVAKAIGEARLPALQPFLRQLIADQHVEVIQMAATSIGILHEKAFVPKLIDLIGDKSVRKFAREALAEFGEQVLPELSARLTHPETKRSIRMNLPRVISMIGVQESVEILVNQLDHDKQLMRYEVLRALNKMRRDFPMLKFPEKTIESIILNETHDYMDTLSVLNVQQHSAIADGEQSVAASRVLQARRLLIKALEEKLDANLERIFRLLGLRYRPRDMYNAYLGVVSNRQDIRANAVEFLDNVLDTSLKRLIIPIVENNSLDALIEMSRREFAISELTEDECFEKMLASPDEWLKACTLYLIAELNETRFHEQVEALLTSSDPIVRETANYAMVRIKNP